MQLVISVALLFTLLTNVSSFMNYGPIEKLPISGNPGKPLFLTPLIETGKIHLAQNLSRVSFKYLEKVRSHSGYLTVNKKFNSNLFFWFFLAENNYEKAPVLLWLQGGPGATSLIGLFTENGPFVTKKRALKLRKYSWTESFNVIYIDSPVGTGYSFTDGGYARNETVVGRDLYVALLQFFKLFPEFKTNEFFVAGESYAGKYVPAVAYTIHKNNMKARDQINNNFMNNQIINLKGLSIGNGFCDPINQLQYSTYLYQLGLLDLNSRDLFKSYQDKGVEMIENKQWVEAFKLFDDLLDGDLSGYNSLFKNITGFDNYFNYLYSNDTGEKIACMGEFVQSAKVRSAIHVGDQPFDGMAKVVEKHLMEDSFQSVTPWISELLNYYRVLFYNGQLDIIVAYPLTLKFLQNLKFDAAEEYKKAKRTQRFVGTNLAGYVKKAGNLTEVLVRNAGHMVPTDQPQWALDLISRFANNKEM